MNKEHLAQHLAIKSMIDSAMGLSSIVTDSMEFADSVVNDSIQAVVENESFDGNLDMRSVNSMFIDLLIGHSAVWGKELGWFDGVDAPVITRSDTDDSLVEKVECESFESFGYTLSYLATCFRLGAVTLSNLFDMVDELRDVKSFSESSDGSIGPLEYLMRMREFRNNMEEDV